MMTMDQKELQFEILADKRRHLITRPYSRENMHKAAEVLGIGRHWFHGGQKAHYDIPKKMIAQVLSNPLVTVVSSRDIILTIDPQWEANNTRSISTAVRLLRKTYKHQ